MTTNAQIDVQALIANVMAAVTPEITKAVTNAVNAEVARIAPKAPATPKATKVAKKATKVRYVTRETRKALIAESDLDLKGWSTMDIVMSAEAGLIELPEGWAVGEGYKAHLAEREG